MWDECPVTFGAPRASPVAALACPLSALYDHALFWRLSEDGNSAPIQLMRPGMINVQRIKLSSEPWRPTLCASLQACGGGETSPDGKSGWRNREVFREELTYETVSKLGRISFALPGVTESALGPRPGETLSASCFSASR